MNWHKTVGIAWLAEDEVWRAFIVVGDESSKRKLPKPRGGIQGAGQKVDLSATDHFEDDIQEIPALGFRPGLLSKVKIEKVDPPASAVDTITDSNKDIEEQTPEKRGRKDPGLPPIKLWPPVES
ncbi:unnamed protein product [Calypogeia fissa]